MPKGIAKEKRPQTVDTEDHVVERFVQGMTWMETHRRLVLLGLVAVGAIAAATYLYVDYRSKLAERAGARLQEIRLSASRGDLQTVRTDLQAFVAQYGTTPYGGEARVLLGGLELQRDSLAAAIQALEPAAELATGTPTAFTAASMLAAAYEQGGRADEALGWWRRIEQAARFPFQERRARAEQARILTYSGRYDEAISIYEGLVAESSDEAERGRYVERLAAVREWREAGAPPPAPPSAVGSPEADAVPEPAGSLSGSPGEEASPDAGPSGDR